MEDLNKNQLILLALLVSFVTSIATGIATVSLLEQAPKEVTRVINRVVERTVETVIPATNVISKQETVVVREEDLITESIAINDSRLVRVFDPQGSFLGVGVIASEDGLVITAPSVASQSVKVDVAGQGMFTGSSSLSSDGLVGIIQLTGSLNDIELDAVVLATINELKLGQSVIALSGATQTTVSMGVVSQVQLDTTAEETTFVSSFDTNISPTELLPGSLVINLFGETIAIYDGVSYLPFTVLRKAINGG